MAKFSSCRKITPGLKFAMPALQPFEIRFDNRPRGANKELLTMIKRLVLESEKFMLLSLVA